MRFANAWLGSPLNTGGPSMYRGRARCGRGGPVAVRQVPRCATDMESFGRPGGTSGDIKVASPRGYLVSTSNESVLRPIADVV